MRDPPTLGLWLRRFLVDYIVTERRLACNTQKTYRDSFALLLPFVSAKARKPVDRLTIEDLAPSCPHSSNTASERRGTMISSCLWRQK